MSDTPEQKKRCTFLNSVRANYTACCKYPTMVVWMWDYKKCKDYCERKFEKDERCCMQPCAYRALGVLNELNSKINWTGLVYSFMLSIGNDTQWKVPIRDSCHLCYNKSLPIRPAALDCEVIPLQLYGIINCAYNEIYYRCPPWNPHQLKECEYTREYIHDCF